MNERQKMIENYLEPIDESKLESKFGAVSRETYTISPIVPTWACTSKCSATKRCK